MTKTKAGVAAGLAVAVYAGGAAEAHASGFQLIEQNASGLGNAYAGQAASAQDASTVFFNPAGMTQLPGRSGVAAIHAIRPSFKFSNAGSTLAPLQTTLGGNGGDGGDWAFVPNAYLSWQVNPQIFVGMGINAPFGLKTEYDAAWVGRFHAIESDLKTINVNPSIALKVSDSLSVGAGVSYQRADATLSNAVNYSAAAFGAGGAALLAAVGGPGREGVAVVEGDDGSWGFNVGLLLSVSPNTRIGVAYRSAVEHHLTGSVTFGNRPGALAAGLPDGPVRADLKLPGSASASIFHRVNPRWDLLGDITWTDWSTMRSLDVYRANGALLSTTPLNWKDTWRVSLGANYHHSSAWTFRFGMAYDQSPTSDADRTPRIPDQDRTWIALGAQYRLSKQTAVDFGYAHLFIKDASVNLCGPAAAAANPAACVGRNNLVGQYESNANVLSAQLRHGF